MASSNMTSPALRKKISGVERTRTSAEIDALTHLPYDAKIEINLD